MTYMTARIAGREIRIEQTLTDRIAGWLSPRWGLQRMAARAQMGVAGGYDAGRRRRRGTYYWRPTEGSADRDIVPDLPDLRARSRDLVRNVPIAGGAVAMQTGSVIGDGLVMQPAVDRSVLGISPEQAAELERTIEREWALFCRTVDFTRVQPFQEMQGLAFRSVLESGDICVVRRYRKDPGDVYGTKIQLVEAERLSNPNRQADTETLVAGVEHDNSGVAVAYHFSDKHPGDLRTLAMKWERIPARTDTGLQLVLHLFDRTRPDQTRGVPYLAPVAERLKQLGDYTDAEVDAALISAFFTVFITSGIDDDGNPIMGAKAPEDGLEADELKLGKGAVLSLNPGEKIETANPNRPNDKFDAFWQAVMREVGVGLDLPFELLIRHFSASYSASRAAVEMAWQFFRRRRAWAARRLCDPVYAWFFEEAVATGRIHAPGFFRDPLIRAAYLSCQWTGPARMSLDPLKDSNADKQDIELGVKTRQQVCVERTGGDWEQKTEQLGKEQEKRATVGLRSTPASTPAASAGNDDRGDAETGDRETGDDEREVG